MRSGLIMLVKTEWKDIYNARNKEKIKKKETIDIYSIILTEYYVWE